MNSPFDADDMMRRSLFSSIMSFRKQRKEASAHPQQYHYVPVAQMRGPDEPGTSHEQPAVAYVPVPVAAPLPHPYVLGDEDEKTQQDIYREIVNECEFLELKPQLAPPSCDHSRDCSPLPPAFSPMTALQHQMQAASVKSPLSSPCPVSPAATTSPTSPMPVLSTPLVAPPAPALMAPALTPAAPPMFVMPEEGNKFPGVSLEEFVKLVVTAVREAGIGAQKTIEKPQKPISECSPEEVLRRKRQQNNEAAARYRKRQREAKEAATAELDGLQSRNKELKKTVAEMEDEIARLKEAVLGQTP